MSEVGVPDRNQRTTPDVKPRVGTVLNTVLTGRDKMHEIHSLLFTFWKLIVYGTRLRVCNLHKRIMDIYCFTSSSLMLLSIQLFVDFAAFLWSA